MNTYSSQIIFTCTQKLIDQDSPNTSTYTSPTLLIIFKKLTYFKNQQEINFD